MREQDPMDGRPVREFAVSFTYIVKARDAGHAMEVISETEPGPDRVTILPNMGV